MSAPLLVFAWGNPSRGDDALGPRLIEQLSARWGACEGPDASSCEGEPDRPAVEFLQDFQLQPEHALDLVGRSRILFVDASLEATAPFAVTALHAARDPSYSSHAMSPQALLQVYEQLHQSAPPPCTLLAIRGHSFELGAALSPAAQSHLDAALDWCERWRCQGHTHHA